MITLDFIRHGEPEGGRRYRGSRIDDPLSERGWQQMWQAVGTRCHWDLVVSSPLQRCLAFAQAVGERHVLPVQVEPTFQEVGFGRWEGLTPEEVRQQDPEGHAAFYRDPVRCRPEGAEDLLHFGQRVAKGYQRLVKEAADRRVLVVAHAGVIRAALGHVLQAPAAAWYRVKVDNAGISRFLHQEGRDQLLFHNRPRLE